MAEPKTPRNWRARIAALPPIDWAALAQDQDKRRWRKTPKQIAATVEHWRLGRLKAAKRRLEARALARKERRRRKHPTLTVAHRLALALDLEHWRTRAELRASTGLKKDSVKLRLMTMLNDGLVERRKNPQHRRVHAGLSTPVYQHRLTERGAALRREAELLS